MNDFYTVVNRPTRFTRARAEQVSSEFDRIQEGFNRLPTRAQLGFGGANFGVQNSAREAELSNHYYIDMDYQVPDFTYRVGDEVRFLAFKTNTGAATINVGGAGDTPLRSAAGKPLTTAEIVAGTLVRVAYDGMHFRVLSQGSDTVVFLSLMASFSLQVNTAISDAIQLPAAVGGTSPYTYAVTGLPDGLSFDATTRQISGTPTATTAASVSYTATDADANDITQIFTVNVVPILLELGQPQNYNLIENQVYDLDISLPAAMGGISPYVYSVSGKPSGMTFDATQLKIFGTASPSGVFSIRYKVTDQSEQSVERAFTITISSAAILALPSVVNISWQQGIAISPVILPAASGGVAPYTYALSNLPEGLSFNATTRQISGTPTEEVGLSTVTYIATDALGNSASVQFNANIYIFGYRYTAVHTDDEGITAAIVTAGNQADGQATALTWPNFSGDSYLIIAQPSEFSDFTVISFGVGNSISDFDHKSEAVQIDEIDYDLWISLEKQGDVLANTNVAVA